MSDQEHTAEPWKTAYRKSVLGGFGQEVFDADGNTIATMAWYAVEIAPGHTGTNREANARRIVACVNACAGISTEKLEEANDLFKAAAAGGATYKRQRDELLAALETTNGKLRAATMCHPNAVETLVEEAFQITSDFIASAKDQFHDATKMIASMNPPTP